MNEISHQFYNYAIELGFSEYWAKYINMFTLLILMFIEIYIIKVIIKVILINFFGRIAKKSKSNFDDILVKNKTPNYVAHIIPLYIAYKLIPIVFVDFNYLENIVEKGIEIFAIIFSLRLAKSFLHSVRDYFKTLPRVKDKPIDSYNQVIMMFLTIAGIILIFAIATDKSIWKFLTAMGAASAVFILIFKDTIMGFVASIQVTVNDMIRIGDWVTFEKFGADGNVIEINLATVKVQNFDKTITTIPTYSLISDSFKNWRGMEDSGGRRIKRAIYIKIESVRFLNEDDVKKIEKIQLISDYIENKQSDIEKFNLDNNFNKELLINGRNLTNLGVFRKYLESYIESHSAISKDMMIMVRQLEPTTQGIPIEIYAFSSDKRWKNYEFIMADIFDHVLSSVSYFDLEVFELPSSSSFDSMKH